MEKTERTISDRRWKQQDIIKKHFKRKKSKYKCLVILLIRGIHSLKEKGPTDAQYTDWQKWFAWKPVKTISGKKVWFKKIYKRQRTIPWTPPTFPVDGLVIPNRICRVGNNIKFKNEVKNVSIYKRKC